MNRAEAIETIKACCNTISAELTRLTPVVGHLGNKPTQDELLKALFQLTKDLEMVKKLARKAENAPLEQ